MKDGLAVKQMASKCIAQTRVQDCASDYSHFHADIKMNLPPEEVNLIATNSILNTALVALSMSLVAGAH